MELHKMEEMLRTSDNIRHEIRKFYDEAFLNIPNRQVVIDLFRIYFIQLYHIDTASFSLLTRVMAQDTYMMLMQDIKQNSLDFDDFFVYSFISNLIDNPSFNDEIIKGIKNGASFFEVMVDYTIYFDKLSILGKKNVVQSSRDCEDELTNICPFYQIDVLNYGLATTVEDFVNYYNDTTQNIVVTPDIISKDIGYHMKHLYNFNKENYVENLIQMCEGFYKWIKIHILMDDFNDKKLEEYIVLLENNDIDFIVEYSILNDKFLLEIINNYMDYRISCGIKVRGSYISKEYLDDYMKDKVPSSLNLKCVQKKK